MKHLQEATVHEVIRLAETARASEHDDSEVDFGELSAGDLAKQLALTAEERELRNYLQRLPDKQMAELMALMWLGRTAGGERREDYPELVEYALTTLDHAASYVAEKAPLADYLRDGLAELGGSKRHT